MFVIQIPTYNVQTYIKRTLHSALAQEIDEPYRIIAVDDQSQDATFEILEAIKKEAAVFKPNVQMDVYRNETRRTQLGNTVWVASQCEPEDVIVHLDHDDQFAHSGVLYKLREVYSDPNVWMTYGSYDYDLASRNKNMGGSPRGISSQVPWDKHSRKLYPFVMSHLKTYKKWLFDLIDDNDLRDVDGEYYKRATEYSWTFPMIEMCGPEHARYIHDILYLYNDRNLTALSKSDEGAFKTEDTRAKNLEVGDRIIAKPEYQRINGRKI